MNVLMMLDLKADIYIVFRETGKNIIPKRWFADDNFDVFLI